MLSSLMVQPSFIRGLQRKQQSPKDRPAEHQDQNRKSLIPKFRECIVYEPHIHKTRAGKSFLAFRD